MAQDSPLLFDPASAMAPEALRAEAAAAVRALAAGYDADDYGDEDEGWDRLEAAAQARCLACDPVALANQFIFAIDTNGDGSGNCQAHITGLQYWKDNDCRDDHGSPIERLLPIGSSEEGAGEWSAPGRPDPAAPASLLASKGFQWTEAFQGFIDESIGGEGLPLLRAAFEAKALAMAAAIPAEGKPSHAPRV